MIMLLLLLLLRSGQTASRLYLPSASHGWEVGK